MNSVYALRDRVLQSGRLVLTLRQFANLNLIPTEHARVYASRLVRRGLAYRVVEGVISLTDDPLIIATQLLEPSYISFTSALYIRDMVKQAPTAVECVTTSRSFRLEAPRIEYHRTVPQLFFGYERIDRFGSYAWVATPEKAVLDMVYFGLHYEMTLPLNKGKLRSWMPKYAAHGGNRGKKVMRWVEELAE